MNSLYSKKYNIAGKPDFIIKKNNTYIPVEFKTGNNNKPHKNHINQLIAYCHLIEENYCNFNMYGFFCNWVFYTRNICRM